jgi:transcription elongation factor Elf1
MNTAIYVCPLCGQVGDWSVQEKSEKALLIECGLCGNIEVLKVTE